MRSVVSKLLQSVFYKKKKKVITFEDLHFKKNFIQNFGYCVIDAAGLYITMQFLLPNATKLKE